MASYRSIGDVPPKRHTQHRDPAGKLYAEELMGEEGFSSDSALLYHRGIPSAMTAARPWPQDGDATAPNEPLLPRHFRLHELTDGWEPRDPVTGRRLIVGNADVSIRYVVAGAPSPYYRNAIGDECVFVEAGAAVVETVFGRLDAKQGDYVVIPRGTTHRWLPVAGEPLRLYAIEAASHIGPPRRYLSRNGQFLEHSPYCERDLHAPSEPALDEGNDVEIHVKHRTSRGIGGTIYTQQTHPFDVVGWDGCLYPYTFNIADFEPITGRIHQPPPVHQVFEATNFVICNFVPRKVDYHPDSIPVPYFHSNVDSDEVMFYCGGDYLARKGSGIGLGSVSLHPNGFTHGPKPESVERSLGIEAFDELAVMVDTFRPLDIGTGASDCEDSAYPWSWAR